MNKFENMVRMASNPIALTGAGISAPSGIPTFQGTWKNQPIRNFLSRDYFHWDYEGFFELFTEMVSWCDKEPNLAHKALAALNIPIITQNIDGLHEKSGAKQVYAMHGTLHTVHCMKCGAIQDAREFAAVLRPHYAARNHTEISRLLRCPHCGGKMDTDVVLYGDSVHHLDTAMDLAKHADLMLVIGTSLITYPAASLPQIARANGAKIVLINEDCVGALGDIVK